jgi:hypothetical protein
MDIVPGILPEPAAGASVVDCLNLARPFAWAKGHAPLTKPRPECLGKSLSIDRMRHRSFTSLLFVIFAVLASFAHATSESSGLGGDSPSVAIVVIPMASAIEHVGQSHAHQHGAADHSQGAAQAVSWPLQSRSAAGQAWPRTVPVFPHGSLDDRLERPPRA